MPRTVLPSALTLSAAVSLVPNLAHARAFGGRFMGSVLFAPVVAALLLGFIALIAGKPPGPATRVLQGLLSAGASTCVGLSVNLFEVSPVWFALSMVVIFALAKWRGPKDEQASLWTRLQHVVDLPMLGAAIAPGLLVLLLGL